MDDDSPAFGPGAEQRMAAPSPLLNGEITVRTTVVQIRWDLSLWHRNDEVRPFFAHLVHQCLKQRPRNVRRLAPLFLVDDKLPWWSSSSVLPSYGGGGGKRSFPRTWLDTRCGEAMQWQWGAAPRALLFAAKIQRAPATIYRAFRSPVCVARSLSRSTAGFKWGSFWSDSMRIFLLGIRRPDFGLNSTEKMTLFQVGCQR
jgi:hypothetical protein